MNIKIAQAPVEDAATTTAVEVTSLIKDFADYLPEFWLSLQSFSEVRFY